MPSKSLPARPNLAHLKHQARDLFDAYQTSNPEALARIREFHPRFGRRASKEDIDNTAFTLSDAQWVIARVVEVKCS